MIVTESYRTAYKKTEEILNLARGYTKRLFVLHERADQTRVFCGRHSVCLTFYTQYPNQDTCFK